MTSSVLDPTKPSKELKEFELLEACETGNAEAVKELLQAGVDPECWSCAAMESASRGKHFDVVQLLLEFGYKDLSYPATECSPTLLIYLIEVQNAYLVEEVLKRGLRHDKAPMAALTTGNLNLLSLVLKYDNNGAYDALYMAIENGMDEACHILVDNGALRDNRDYRSLKPALNTAYFRGFNQMADLMKSELIALELLDS